MSIFELSGDDREIRTGIVTASFSNKSEAERAAEELKKELPQTDPRLAVPAESGATHRLKKLFSLGHHSPDVSAFRDSLSRSGIPEGDLDFVTGELMARGAVLFSRALVADLPRAVEILSGCGGELSPVSREAVHSTAEKRSFTEQRTGLQPEQSTPEHDRTRISQQPEIRQASYNPEPRGEKAKEKLDRSQEQNELAASNEQRVTLTADRVVVQKDRVSEADIKWRKETITAYERIEVPVQREELLIQRRKPDGEGVEETRVLLWEEKVRFDTRKVTHCEVVLSRETSVRPETFEVAVAREEMVVEHHLPDGKKKEIRLPVRGEHRRAA